MPRPPHPEPAGRRPRYPPFALHAGLHDRALEQALRRYCVTTTGPVVIELSEPPSTARDADVLARVATQLESFGRPLVITPRREAPTRARGRPPSSPVRDGRHTGALDAAPYTPVV